MATFTINGGAGLAIQDNSVVTDVIHVSGLAGVIIDVSVNLIGLTHTFSGDLDMLLVGPNGRDNLLFMSDCQGGDDLTNDNITFGNYGIIPHSTSGVTPWTDSLYVATDYGHTETDAQFGTSTGHINGASPDAPYVDFQTSFWGADPNGNWTLAIADDAGGDTGTLANWSLEIVTDSAVAAPTGTSGDDTITIVEATDTSGQFQIAGVTSAAGIGYSGVLAWSIDGGSGFDRLVLGRTGGDGRIDLSTSDLYSIEAIEIFLQAGAASIVRIDASDIGAGRLAQNAQITATNNDYEQLQVTLSTTTSVDLSGFTFTGFDQANDWVKITGDGSNESIVGSSQRDLIFGNGGNDVINGGLGADTMNGGAGDDTYYVDQLGDYAAESTGGSGFDTAYASVNIIAGTGIDRIILTGAAYSATGLDGQNDDLRGNTGANLLSGMAGADYLDGGSGVDQMFGGAGDDRIVYDALDDLANMQGGADFDTLLIGTQAPPVSFNLFSHGFEQAEGTTIDTGSAAWSTNTWTYDQAWRAVKQALVMDNGSKLVNGYTVTGLLDWTEDYDAGGARTRFTNFDEGGAEGWSSYYDLFSAGVRTQRYTAYDNGTAQREGFDPAGNVLWRQEYNSSGAQIRYTQYDIVGVYDWVSYYDLFSGGARTQQYMSNDDNTAARTGFDAQGRVDWIQEYFVNGNLARYVDYDQATNEPWQYSVTYYDLAGNQTSRYILYDNGTELFI